MNVADLAYSQLHRTGPVVSLLLNLRSLAIIFRLTRLSNGYRYIPRGMRLKSSHRRAYSPSFPAASALYPAKLHINSDLCPLLAYCLLSQAYVNQDQRG